MRYSIDKSDNFTVFTLDEENLNSIIAPDLKSEFIILRNEGVKNLIFDLKNVKYVDSSGLSAILTANRLWKGYGYFVLTDIKHDPVKRLIEISRLDSILTITPEFNDAVKYIEDNVEELPSEEN